MLLAMAAVKGVRLVCIDTSNLKDCCHVFTPDPRAAAQECMALSWAEEIVPGMQRGQQAGSSAPCYKVILWNGRQGRDGHFDATTFAQDAA